MANREAWSPPRLYVETEVLLGGARHSLPGRHVDLDVAYAPVAESFFDAAEDQCIHISGDNAALRVESSSFKLPDAPFTLECRARPSREHKNAGLIAKTEMSEFAFFLSEGKVRFEVFLDGEYRGVESPHRLPVGEWSHIAGVYDGQKVRLYLNGTRVAEVEASGSRKGNRLPLYIGADPNFEGQANQELPWRDR